MEAKLNDFLANNVASIDIDTMVYKAVENFKKLDLLYLNEGIEEQRYLSVRCFLKNGRMAILDIEPL